MQTHEFSNRGVMKRIKTVIFLSFLGIVISGCAYDIVSERMKLESTGHYGELETYEEGLARKGANTSNDIYSRCHAYLKVKRYGKLMDCLDQLENRFSSGEKSIIPYPTFLTVDGTPVLHLMRAEALIDLGDYGSAVKEADHAKLYMEGKGDSYSYPIRMMFQMEAEGLLGIAHALRGDTDSAIKSLNSLYRTDLRFLGIAITAPVKQSNISRLLFSLRRCNEVVKELSRGSEPQLIKSLIQGLSGAPRGENIFANVDLPRAYMAYSCDLETGNIAKAREGFDSLLLFPHIETIGNIYPLILYDRGRIAEKEGNIKEAIRFYRKAVDMIEFQRSTINTEASKIGFVGDKQEVYRRLIASLVEEKQIALAFDYVERAKSRALVDMLASKKDFAAPNAGIDIREILAVTGSSEEAVLTKDTFDKSKPRGLIVTARRQLQEHAPELASLVTVTTLTSENVQSMLTNDETLIEYFYDDKTLYIFVLTQKEIRVVRMGIPDLVREVQEFRRAIEDHSSVRYIALSQSLYTQLIEPVKTHINTPHLLIVAHGMLHYLPFSALSDGKNFLIDNYSLRFLPGASVLKFIGKDKFQKRGGMLAFGNPDLGDPRMDLMFAQQEAVSVDGLFPNSRTLLRREATESAFKKFGTGFNYLHLATHGMFNADAPLASALLLARDTENDGMLTVGDLYSLRLDTNLVTLSACETGIGKISNGDDVVGLTRGFLYAGASTIVASLWKVDDLATSQLMVEFYSHLKKLNKKDALRQAQLTTKKRYRHPFFWAAFQLTGTGD